MIHTHRRYADALMCTISPVTNVTYALAYETYALANETYDLANETYDLAKETDRHAGL